MSGDSHSVQMPNVSMQLEEISLLLVVQAACILAHHELRLRDCHDAPRSELSIVVEGQIDCPVGKMSIIGGQPSVPIQLRGRDALRKVSPIMPQNRSAKRFPHTGLMKQGLNFLLL